MNRHTPRTWEDRINFAGCADVIAAREQALSDQRAAIAALREPEPPQTPPAPPVQPPERRTRRQPSEWTPERIQRLRRAYNQPQAAFAALIGISRQDYWSYEHGRRSPGVYVSARLNELERQLTPGPAPEPNPPGYWTAARIGLVRTKLGWSQDRLAQHLGCGQRTVSDWETGRTSPRQVVHLNRLDALERRVREGVAA